MSRQRISRPGSHLVWLASALLVVAVSGCEGDVGTGPGGDAGPNSCAASQESGLYMVPFGPLTQTINVKGTAKITVAVIQGSQKEGEGSAASGKRVSYRIITTGGDASLSLSDATTDKDGLGSVNVLAGTQAMDYQVEASLAGTCPLTFSVTVKKPLRQLRIVSPLTSPYDTFTSSRIPIAVEATTDGNAKLSSEQITFKVSQGATSETLLALVSGSSGSATVQTKTNSAGRATVMLETGSKAIPQLVVTASMSGTADASAILRIVVGTSKGCTTSADCPLGYNCNKSKCEPQPTTPASGCKSSADCTSPNTCDTTTGQCIPPASTPSGGCKSDSDCTSPYVCDTTTAKCLLPTGSTCDAIEGTGCKTGEVCVGRVCAKLPTGCTTNSDCPTGYVCTSGQCVPAGKPPTGGCVTNANCPSTQACINGVCTNKTACTIVHNKDRLKGTWKYDSTLKLHDALSPVLSGFLSASSVLNTIIKGTFKISGVPSFINSIVKSYLKSLVNQYVPSWAQQLISTLAAINDVVQDMRVLSTVQTTSTGNDTYTNSEQWDLVEFKYQGKTISSPPSAISQVGTVKVNNYSSTEVCGVLFIAKHKIQNIVGGIIKWAINTALALISCNVSGSPCFSTVDQALQYAINCAMLGAQLDMMVQSFWSGAPSVSGLVQTACEAEKTKLIAALNKALNDLTVKLSLLELSGTVTIPSPGQDTQLSGGILFGVLGTSVIKGNFKGSFSAKKSP